MPIIVNNLESQQDIDNYNKWLSNKGLNSIKRIKRMLETDKKYRPNRWENVDLKIKLMEEEIARRKL